MYGHPIRAMLMLVVPHLHAPLLPAQEIEQTSVTGEHVAASVHMLTGAGGNIGVSAGQDGVFLVDDQYAPLTEKIRAAVAVIDSGPIRFVLNTHWHGDHTGGNENLGRAGALIVAHDNVRRRMSTEQFMAAFNERVPASPAAALPVVTFSDSVTFHLNGDSIVAFHVAPAHTDGDALVYFAKANVAHTGDTFFNGMYPFIDIGSGGSLDGMIAAAAQLLRLGNAETRIIPGHGPLATKGDVRAYHEMLLAVRSAIEPLARAGRTLAEVQALKPTAALDAKWGKGFLSPEQFVSIIYANYEQR